MVSRSRVSLAAGGTLAWQWILVRDDGPITTMAGMVRVDGFGVFLGIIVVIATALALLLSVAYLRREGLEGPEYLALDAASPRPACS